MLLRIASAIICVLCIVVFRPQSLRAGIELTQHEINSLVQGRAVLRPLHGSGTNSTIAGVSFALINAPVDVVWRAVEDVSAWRHIFSNTHECHAVAGQDNVRVVKMSMGNKVLKADFHLTAVFHAEKYELTYTLNKKKPHDIEETRGSMKLLPQPGGLTLVAFTTLVKIPFAALVRLMGDKVIGWIEYRVLITPKRLKNWVEGPSGAKYREVEP